MSRKLVTVRKIAELLPIEGADAIELAVVDGWKCVVRKGEFSVGDYAVYFEIDSFLPSTDYRFESFMKNSREYLGVVGHKLRTIKLRGQISQGLAMPLLNFPEIWNSAGSPNTETVTTNISRAAHAGACDFEDAVDMAHVFAFTDNPENFEGKDFAEVLGIVKWEPPVSGAVQGQAAGSFPSFIRKTDQERHQNLKREIFGYDDVYSDFPDGDTITQEAFDAMLAKGQAIKCDDGVYRRVNKAKASPDTIYEVTLKLDGTSCTYFKRDGEVGVCSRNLQLKINEENIASNALVNIFVTSGLQKIFESNTSLKNIAIQGEVMGPGIQGNRENFKHPALFVFDIFDIDAGEYLSPVDRDRMFTEIMEMGVNKELVKHVPVIAIDTLPNLGIVDTESLIKYAEGPSINHAVREGVVFKRLDGKFSFKSISNTFLAKEKD